MSCLRLSGIAITQKRSALRIHISEAEEDLNWLSFSSRWRLTKTEQPQSGESENYGLQAHKILWYEPN